MRAIRRRTSSYAALCAAAIFTLIPRAPASGQGAPPYGGYSKFIVGAAATGSMEADPKGKVIGFVSTRATYRFQPDFSVFAEGSLGASGASRLVCINDNCSEHELGSRRIRAWHVGMETRLAGYGEKDRHRLMFGAGLGRIFLKHYDLSETISKPSLQASVALEIPVRDRIAARVATVGYFSEMVGANRGMNGIWEIIGLQAGLNYGF